MNRTGILVVMLASVSCTASAYASDGTRGECISSILTNADPSWQYNSGCNSREKFEKVSLTPTFKFNNKPKGGGSDDPPNDDDDDDSHGGGHGNGHGHGHGHGHGGHDKDDDHHGHGKGHGKHGKGHGSKHDD